MLSTKAEDATKYTLLHQPLNESMALAEQNKLLKVKGHIDDSHRLTQLKLIHIQ